MGNSEPVVFESGRDYRRFQIADAMILVAAAAIGLALAKAAVAGIYRPRAIPAGFHWYYTVDRVHTAAFWCLAPVTIACFVLRLKQPRPSLFSMLAQPGTSACLFAIVGLMVGAIVIATSGAVVSLHIFAYLFSILIGMGVASAWAMLWWNQSLKSEPGWIDRMGRVLGGCWIILPFILWSAFLF